MFQISKDFAFSADHALSGLPEGHKCARFHGHNYVVRVVLQSDSVRGPGFVRDYGELSSFKDYLDTHFDHRWLGTGTIARVIGEQGATYTHRFAIESVTPPVVDFNPTAENLAGFFFGILRGHLGFSEVAAVAVSETPKTWAWFDEGSEIFKEATDDVS